MSKSAWGNIGAWADEAERADAEEKLSQKASSQAGFPSLKEASTTTKQKKKTKMTLQEFTMQVPQNDDVDILRQLPTAPKQRSPDEQTQFSGFSSYSSRPGFSSGYSHRSQQSRVSDSDQPIRRHQFQSQLEQEQLPSRADGVDNWASMKKQTLPLTSNRSQSQNYNSDRGLPQRYGSLGAASRADEVGDWASEKKLYSPISSSDLWAGSKGRTFGSGFAPSRPEPDSWVRNEGKDVIGEKENEDVTVRVNKPNPFGAARPREELLAEKGLDWKKIDLEIEVKKQQEKEKTSRPTSSQSSRPGSSQSSRPEEVTGGEVVKPKPKVNPFGDAKPREVLLEEKGLDWKKIDLNLEHRRVDRPETEEEKKLKEEIEHLKAELSQISGEDATGLHDLILVKERDFDVLVRQLDDKVRYSQKAFERQGAPIRGAGLSDRPHSRPGSLGFHDRPPSRTGPHEDPRTGYQDRPPSRPGLYEDRPPSRPGAYEDPRGDRPPSRPGAYDDRRAERPRSRQGAFDESRDAYPPQRSSFQHDASYQDPRIADYNGRQRPWTRPSDDRRAFHGGGGGGRGFSSNRDVDRSGSRW